MWGEKGSCNRECLSKPTTSNEGKRMDKKVFQPMDSCFPCTSCMWIETILKAIKLPKAIINEKEGT